MVATIAGVDNFEEIEQVGLWSNEQYLEAFESCGMEARWDASAFAGLYLADPTDQVREMSIKILIFFSKISDYLSPKKVLRKLR